MKQRPKTQLVAVSQRQLPDASGFNTSVAGVATLDPTDDGDPCTVDTCDAVTGVSHADQEGLACDDGDLCTTGDASHAAGA